MIVRRRAERWAEAHNISIEGSLRASKYYPPEESRSKRAAWWVEVPLAKLDSVTIFEVFCETGVEVDNFYHLAIPATYLKANKEKFHLTNNKISLWLSAEERDLFKDTHPRGGNVDFGQFLKL